MRDPASTHLPALDGIRGIAILAVLAAHLAPTIQVDEDGLARRALSFGVLGVDLFFVLSGFLITGILLDAKGRPGYFRSFYARRVLRIFPAYYAYLVVIGLLVRTGTIHLARADWLPWHLAYLSNMMPGRGVPLVHYLSHMWSLAIEEQFYLVWPAVVSLAGRRSLLALCLAGVVLVGATRAVAAWEDVWVETLHRNTFLRLDTLLAGAALALWARRDGGPNGIRRYSVVLVLVGGVGLALAASGVARRGFDDPLAATAMYSAMIPLSVGLVGRAVTAPPGSWAQAWPLRTAGRYSYGLYIWHMLAFAAVGLHRFTGDPPAVRLVGVAGAAGLAFLFAAISWVLIERPLLRLKRFFPRPGSERDAPPETGRPAAAGRPVSGGAEGPPAALEAPAGDDERGRLRRAAPIHIQSPGHPHPKNGPAS